MLTTNTTMRLQWQFFGSLLGRSHFSRSGVEIARNRHLFSSSLLADDLYLYAFERVQFYRKYRNICRRSGRPGLRTLRVSMLPGSRSADFDGSFLAYKNESPRMGERKKYIRRKRSFSVFYFSFSGVRTTRNVNNGRGAALSKLDS